MEQLADIVGGEGAIGGDVGQRDVLAEIFMNIEQDLLNVGIELGAFGKGGCGFSPLLTQGEQHDLDKAGADLVCVLLGILVVKGKGIVKLEQGIKFFTRQPSCAVGVDNGGKHTFADNILTEQDIVAIKMTALSDLDRMDVGGIEKIHRPFFQGIGVSIEHMSGIFGRHRQLDLKEIVVMQRNGLGEHLAVNKKAHALFEKIVKGQFSHKSLRKVAFFAFDIILSYFLSEYNTANGFNKKHPQEL